MLKFTKIQIQTVLNAMLYFQQREEKQCATIEGYAHLSDVMYPFYSMLIEEPWMTKEALAKIRDYLALPKPKPITADRYLVNHFSFLYLMSV